VLLSAVGFGLRAAAMGQSLLGDELFTFEISTRPGLHDVLAGVRSDLEVTPPLHFVVAWAAAQLGDPRVWLRVPSLVAGAAAVPLTYLLGARTLGRPAGLLGAALMALSPFAIFYSVEARAYALLMLLLVASSLVLMRAVSVRGGGAWATYAFLACAALYTHYTAAFVLAAQGGWAAWFHRDRLRELLLAYAAVALAYAPWLPFLLEDVGSTTQLYNQAIAPLSLDSLGDALVTWLLGMPLTGVGEVPGAAGLALIAAGLAIALAGAARARAAGGGRKRPSLRPEGALIFVIALASPVGAVLYSIGGSSFLPRNLIGSLPALCVAAGGLLTSIRRPLGAVAAALVLAGMALGALAALGPDQQRPAYRDAAELIDARLGPGDPVLEVLPIPTGSPARRALQVNFERPHPLFRTGEAGGTVRALRAARGRELAVVVPAGALGAAAPSPAELGRGFRLVERRSYRGLAELTVYRWRSTAAR
jgi:mannosyltransferase